MVVKPMLSRVMERRRAILAFFRTVLVAVVVLLVGFALVAGLMLAAVHFDGKLDQMQQEIVRTRWELEGIKEQQELIWDRLDKLQEGQESWLERFEVRRVTTTAYAPLDPRAVAGMCYSGDPNVTANGQAPVPGETAAGGTGHSFGDVVLVEGLGPRVINDRGGRITGYNLDLVKESRQEALKHGVQELLIIYERR